ncbi:hypothetical protein [Nocardia sp. NPDC052566]|uniref:hypothetical protein n=1 Tax=Nocardia sp. NPDC052566 TaxID=3364330 RepID=UPI0037CBA339
MTTVLVILAVWAVASVPIALIVARLFRSSGPDDPERPDPPRHKPARPDSLQHDDEYLAGPGPRIH